MECQESIIFVKCTYCRTEFQESSKDNTTSVCKKCETNVKLYGKPTACEYCNIIAAFIGAKCQRCTNSEKKYGPPVPCEQCKQKSAFDRKDDRRKVDGKLLCWLCTLSYKRALAKTKGSSSSRHSSSYSKSSSHHRSSATLSSSHSHKRSASHSSKPKKEHSPSKKPRPDVTKAANGLLPTSESMLLDLGTSDHVVAMHQLKDQIAQLNKQLKLKDQEMLARDRKAAEERAQHGILERELRVKIKDMQKQHGDTVEDLQSKVRVLQKQVITLSKENKKKGNDSDSPRRPPVI